jgi:hypothetical protein
MYVSSMGHRLMVDGSSSAHMKHILVRSPEAYAFIEKPGDETITSPVVPDVSIEDSKAAVINIMKHLAAIYPGNSGRDLMAVLLAWSIPVVSLAMPVLLKAGANPIAIVYGLGACGKTTAAKFAAMATGMLSSRICTGRCAQYGELTHVLCCAAGTCCVLSHGVGLA